MSNARADRVKDVARLAGRPARLRQNRFLAEGPQTVREALRLHVERRSGSAVGVVDDLYITAATLDRHPDLGMLAETAGLECRIATDEVLAAMASTVTPQGVLAVCREIDIPLEKVLAGNPRLVAVLVEVRDPGNAGTILRAADSAGADAVIVTRSSVDLYNPKTVRSTVGSLFHLPVVLGMDASEVFESLAAAGIAVLAADGYGAHDLHDLQDESARRRFGASPSSAGPRLENPTAWLFGNEAQGLPAAALEAADYRVAVPLYGQAESLNVGTAATVCLYASARSQRKI